MKMTSHRFAARLFFKVGPSFSVIVGDLKELVCWIEDRKTWLGEDLEEIEFKDHEHHDFDGSFLTIEDFELQLKRIERLENFK